MLLMLIPADGCLSACLFACLSSHQVRRAEEAKQAKEEKEKQDRENALRRVAGGNLCCGADGVC